MASQPDPGPVASEHQPEAPAVPGVTRYRTRGPIAVEAIRWTGGNEEAVRAFTGSVSASSAQAGDPGFTVLRSTVDDGFIGRLRSTAAGRWVDVPAGWYVVKGVTGRFCAVDGDWFAAICEPAPEKPAGAPEPADPDRDTRRPFPAAPEPSRDRTGASPADGRESLRGTDDCRRALWILVSQSGGDVFLSDRQLAEVPRLPGLALARGPGGLSVAIAGGGEEGTPAPGSPADVIEAAASLLERRCPGTRPEAVDTAVTELRALARSWRARACSGEEDHRGR